MEDLRFALPQADRPAILREYAPVPGKLLDTDKTGIADSPADKDVLPGRKLLGILKNSHLARTAFILLRTSKELQAYDFPMPTEVLYVAGSVFTTEKNEIFTKICHRKSDSMFFMFSACSKKSKENR